MLGGIAIGRVLAYWKEALLVALVVYAAYVWMDRARARAEADRLDMQVRQAERLAEARGDRLEILTRTYETMSTILEDRRAKGETIASQVGALRQSIDAAAAKAETAYAQCAAVDLDPGVQTQIDALLGYEGES